METTETRSTLTARDIRSTLTTHDIRSMPLFWAAVFSVAFHSALVTLPLAQQGRGTRTAADSAQWIEAALVSPSESAAGVDALVAPPPLERSAEFTLPAQPPPAPTVTSAVAPRKPANRGMQGGMLVEAQPLQDKDRLGDGLMTRQVSEFPVELEYPVRLTTKIVARYPPAALAAGREGSVAVWILVDAQGKAEEIQVTDGSEEFADAVLEAIRGARFLPAQNNLLPIRFPISLEFRFEAPAPTAVAEAPAERTQP